ncbi:hypothetical protein ACLB2K_071099 [Fragaria x ananassa]
MGKQKQQVISRFFAPKPKPQNPNDPTPPTPPPKITATVAFSPSKRLLSSHLTSSPKRPKLSPHTHNPIPTTPNPSLHQKFLQKFLEPSTTIPQPPPSNPKLTPLELQVVDLKKRYPDVLLMVEVGYKYRFFGEDAEIAARNLGIYAHMDHSFLTASVPTFRLNVHVRRLVSAGYKVGVVKQTETAAIKAHGANRGGPFGRGLSALYTKATLEAAEGVGGGEEGCGGESSYLGCVVDDESGNVGSEVRIGIVAVEISTGDVVYGEFRDDFMRSGLEAFVLSLSPAELLLGEPLSKQTEKMLLAFAGPASNVRVERVSRDCFKDGGALAEVMSLYENMDGDKLGDRTEINSEVIEKGNHHLGVEGIMKMPNLAVQALALTIRHLKQFGLERVLHLGASFRPFSSNVEMTLSANALQQLEVLETTLQDNFVPNDTDLHADREYCQIITGPNMGGKSCYIRQVALIAIMAQVGSFVPASLARLHVLDGIYTRMGASDSIQQGRSTFLEELSEASHILHNCAARSLVIIDELGRGTSTHDGVAIAYATLHHLLQQKRCMVLFVTHYPKIASIRTEFPGSVGAYHVSYLTSDRDRGTVDMTSENEDVTYLYKLVPGISERSFGFKVAELAQLPSSCIRRATFMADRLEAVVRRRESDRYGNKSLLRPPTIDQKEEVEEEMLGTTDNAYAGENQIKEDIYGSEYNKFFQNLKTAISSDDLTESIRYMNHARSIAQELVSR